LLTIVDGQYLSGKERCMTVRKGEHPQTHLAGYAGILQADAYDGYNKCTRRRNNRPLSGAYCGRVAA
jgi:hypothetical protein